MSEHARFECFVIHIHSQSANQDRQPFSVPAEVEQPHTSLSESFTIISTPTASTTSAALPTATATSSPSELFSRPRGVVETASQAGPSSDPQQTSALTTTNPRIRVPNSQPPYPSPSPIPASSTPEPQIRVTSPTRWSLRNAFIGGGNPDFASPFRNRSGTVGSNNPNRGRPRRPSAARLWNPSNSTRVLPQRRKQSITKQRNRSPEDRPVIAIPLEHPDINSPREGATAGGDYPLLTLPEQRQIRHSGSTRASLQVERSGSSNGTSNRISLPRSVSIDLKRLSSDVSPITPTFVDKGKGRAVDEETEIAKGSNDPAREDRTTIFIQPSKSGLTFDKGKGKAVMSADLEQGPLGQYIPGGTAGLPNNGSKTSFDGGIGPALSDDTSIVGSDGPPQDPSEEWGPRHPCFPHMNSHVPLTSELYQTTRIIRVKRDWMIEGDLAPTFSNLYPEILDPAGVTEADFRTLIEKINHELVPAFNPWAARNVLDAFLGLLTGWLWDDFGFTAVKSRLNTVERYLEEWNQEMESKSKEPGTAPKIVSLRRTGYMNVCLPFSPHVEMTTNHVPTARYPGS